MNSVRASGLARLARRRPLSLVALVYLVLLALAAIAAPVIAPYSATVGDLSQSLKGPSGAHWLGTDQLGRDTLSRLLYGARPSLLYAVEAVTVALLLGVSLGLVAGFVGRTIDRILIAVADVFMAMPGLVILLVVLSVFQQHMSFAMIALGMMLFGPLMRVVRAATLSVRNELFVDAARVAGLSTTRILVRHVLPRIKGVILVQGSVLGGMALLMTTGLAYLGFGTTPPAPSWGLSIADGAQIMGSSPVLLYSAGATIALTVIAFGVLGDGLRDIMIERWQGPPPKPSRKTVAPAPAAAGATAPADPEAVLSLRGVDVSYPSRDGEMIVVRNASFDVRAHEAVGLVGESGSGKTATARAVLGILRGGRVSAGEILIGGKSIADAAAPGDLKVGYISQEPHVALDPTWRVGALVAESVRHHTGVSKSAAHRRALELLTQVRLPDPEVVARRYPHELSGGMAQRVAIARALASEPRLLIADEPTTALDVTVQAEILDLLRNLQAETGLAILLITHDWGVVADLCDRAIVMYAGEVVEQGSVASIFQKPGHPYTIGLMASNPARIVDRYTVLPAIPGVVPSPEDWPVGCHFQNRCAYATTECAQNRISLVAVGTDHLSRCLHIGALERSEAELPPLAVLSKSAAVADEVREPVGESVSS